MAIGAKNYTFEAFEQLLADPENQNRLLELIDGEIVEKMPTEEHGIIAGWIITFLNNYLLTNPVGYASVEARHRLEIDRKNSLLPDVSFIKGKRKVVIQGSVPQMPDLAVEIKSPDDDADQMRAKARYYLEHGSQLVWLVFPRQQTVEVYAIGSAVKTLGMEDQLDGGAVLPGLSIPIQRIFPAE